MNGENYNSVEFIQSNSLNAIVCFDSKSSKVFKEDTELHEGSIDNITYVMWGEDDQMPYDVLELHEKDETLSTCQQFNAEVCYGAGLRYNTEQCSANVKSAVREFCVDNNLPYFFMGCCQDLKYFGWCLSVIILNENGDKILQISRKEAAYCRFAKADENGVIQYVLYGNFRRDAATNKVEKIPLLNPAYPMRDLRTRMEKSKSEKKFAILTRIPTVDSTYYPIPYYASIFRSKWYDIKGLIAVAKEAKLKHSSYIKYHVEIADGYWQKIFQARHITDEVKKQEAVKEEKKNIIDFLTGAENSGRMLFSTFYKSPTGEEQHDVKITRIDDKKEGGDWESDIQESINIMCFTLRVHSNLVGSVPGKAQSNNSGSDKRELYTIAQALQKPYHDMLFVPHNIIIAFNNWENAEPECPMVMLTTLDEHKDAKLVSNK